MPPGLLANMTLDGAAVMGVVTHDGLVDIVSYGAIPTLTVCTVPLLSQHSTVQFHLRPYMI